MRALVYEAPRVMTLRTVPDPVPGPDEVVIAVRYSGICGSELSGFLGTNSLRTPPLVFGHELSGHVVQTGDRVPELPWCREGAAVTANPLASCGRCEHCLGGQQQRCPDRRLLGAHVPGANAEFVSVPWQAVLGVPEGVELRQAAMAEPAAYALRAVGAGAPDPSSTALVVGAGPIGLFILQVLACYGVRTRFVFDRHPDRCAAAARTGAVAVPSGVDLPTWVRDATGGRGCDLTFDAVGSEHTRLDCVQSAALGGQVLLCGLHTDRTALPLNTVVRSEIRLTGVFGYTDNEFRTAFSWLAEGRIGLREGVVEAPLEAGQDWYTRLVEGDAAAKVLLTP